MASGSVFSQMPNFFKHPASALAEAKKADQVDPWLNMALCYQRFWFDAAMLLGGTLEATKTVKMTQKQ